MPLLTSQKNQLFDLIRQRNIDPSIFNLTENNYHGLTTTEIRHLKSNYFFKIQELFRSNSLEYSPARNKFKETLTSNSFESLTLGCFVEWIDSFCLETSIENKWDIYIKEAQNIKFIFKDDSNKFTDPELKLLGEKLKVLKEGISTIGLNENAKRLFNLINQIFNGLFLN